MVFKKGDPRPAAFGRKGMAWRWRDKTDDNRRTKQIHVYVTAEERKQIMDKAQRLGITRTELLIRAALEYEPS